MNSSLCPCRESDVKSLCLRAGAVAVGIARAGAVDAGPVEAYRRWIADGCHGSMDYMARNMELRADPRRLFPGAVSVISMAFPFRPAGGYQHPLIADYALGLDYHHVIKARLAAVTEAMAARYGAMSRVCVDTAPVMERYWAVQAGVGFIGLNRQLIVPGVGSGVFLAEIITTMPLRPDEPCRLSCDGCRRCIAACPAAALSDCRLDASRCRSYLTIECRDLVDLGLGPTDRVYGCDICAHVCPHNRVEPPEPLPEFSPDPRLLTLNRDALSRISSSDFKKLFKKSAISRIKFEKMRTNSKINIF